MKKAVLCTAFAVLLTACETSPPQERKAENPSPKIVVDREKSDREAPLPPEVKIRLKKDGKENYSWELSGSDVDQVLKVNEKLKRALGGEPSK